MDGKITILTDFPRGGGGGGLVRDSDATCFYGKFYKWLVMLSEFSTVHKKHHNNINLVALHMRGC